MSAEALANVVLTVHAAYVAFVVLGQGAILLGGALGWQWVRNVWFRLIHLAAIGFVALESLIGMACPLTVWEDQLRSLAGQDVAEGTFIGRALRWLLFWDCESWVFTTVYVGFALLTAATLLLLPPRWAARRAAGDEAVPVGSGAASGRPA